MVVLLGVIPRLNQSIPNREGCSLVRRKVVEVEASASEGVLDVVDNLALNALAVGAHVRAHQLPHLVCALLGVVVLELRL